MDKIKKFLVGIEVLGILVLTLVFLAVQDTNIIHYQYYWLIVAMFVMVSISLIVAICHTVGHFARVPRRLAWIISRIRPYWGVVILLCGGVVFFGFPEFFWELQNHPPVEGYWNLVSVYSLPAILVEGGLYTLVTEFYERHQARVSSREMMLLLIGFFLYVSISTGFNFMVLAGVMTPHQQIMAARIVIIGAMVVGAAIWIRIRHKPQ